MQVKGHPDIPPPSAIIDFHMLISTIFLIRIKYFH